MAQVQVQPQPPLSRATSLSVDRTDSRVPRPGRSTSSSSSSSSSSVFMSTRLYVVDLEPNVTKSQLTELFSPYGKLVSVHVFVNPHRSLGYAYVDYRYAQDAARAMDMLNFMPLNNKPIRIMYSHRDPSIRKSGAANIFIKNLDKSLDDEALRETFSVFGAILSCKIATDESGQSKGHGFVHFDLEEAAQNAIENLNGTLIKDKQVYVGPFLCKQQRDMSTDKTKFNNVYVKNFSESTTEEDLKMVFGEYGTITSVVVKRDGDGKSKCFGFVNFEDADDAAQAVEDLNGKKFDDKEWYVGKAQKKSEREMELKGQFYQSMKEAVGKFQGVNLYLKNLDDSIGDDKVRELFSEFGTITSCKVMRDPGGISRGSGFVAFSTPEEASRALSEMNGKIVVNKPLHVALAQRKEDRKARLQAQFSQMRPVAMPPSVAPRVPMYPPSAPPMVQVFYGQGPPALIPPQAQFSQMQPVALPPSVAPRVPMYPPSAPPMGQVFYGQGPPALIPPQVNEGNTADCSKELLFNQTNHISEGIRQGEELGRMRCILTNPDKDIWVLTETQKEYVRQTGLHHLAGIDRMVIDHALITALIERWCPETNSFHLPFGEATITLEDVAYIYGLPVDGPLVTGRTFSSRFVEPVCQELLGITPQKMQDYIGITIKFKWLEDNFKSSAWHNKKKKKNKDDEIRATRAYLFFLVAGQIFTQTSGASGPVYLLELFKEFKPYAWAPACLANVYRMLAKATWWGHETKEAEGKGKDQQKSCRASTGPLQLLQIWAYSRMSIGRCPLPDPSWKKDIQFPLFKTWHRRLGDHPPLATVNEVRDQLNSLPADGFTWRPYSDYGKKFRMSVPKGDRDLFSSSTVLVCYWIVERHNTWRVMKQFGLKQLVPPPFNVPYVRREHIERVVIDYSLHMDEEIAALWAARSQLGLLGEKCNQPGHSEEYFVWYLANTVRHIGRVEHRESNETKAPAQQADPFVLQKYVDVLVARLERSCDRAERRKKSNSSLAASIRKNLKTFKAAFGTRFENFSMEQADCSQSDEDVEKTIPDTDAGPSHTVPPYTDPETTVGPFHTGPPPHTRVEKAAIKSPKANTYRKKGTKRHDDVPSKGQPADLPPFEEVLNTPPIARTLFDVPMSVNSDSVIVASAPMATIVSLIWIIKRLPRMRKVSVKIFDYSHSMVYSGYVLNDQEQFLVGGFREYYATKADELASICTMVSSKDLKKALEEGTWLDTNLMYYYFEIMREGCPTAFIADPSISSWWQDGSDASVEAAFGKHGHKVWEAWECRTLVFVLHYRNHFTLVVGYVDEKRWEFYNSLADDLLTRSIAEQFIGWLNAMYMHFGWADPFLWTILIKEDIPHQNNRNDCGVFAMAFAEHCIHRRSITFTQSDIPYFRSRIVIELFKRSLQVNANRLNLLELNQPV